MGVIRLDLQTGDRRVAFAMDDCDGLDYVVAQAVAHGLQRYEEPYPSLIAAIVSASPGDVLDIGANTGLYALLAAHLHETVRVHAFEPLPALADRLQVNCALNPHAGRRISVHRLALSDAVGTATFFETINAHGLLSTSSTLDRGFAEAIGAFKECRVDTTTLDAWARGRDLDDIVFVKIDVEGHERCVLAGGLDVIGARRPIVGIEMLANADFEFLGRFLEEVDYVDCVTAPDRIRFAHRPAFAPDGWNHLLVPVERVPLVADLGRRIGLGVG